MGKIPTYQAGQQLNTGIGNISVPKADPSAGIAAGESVQKAGGLVSAYLNHFADLKDQQQVLQAENIAQEKFDDVYTRYQSDPDFNSTKKYNDELDKITNDVSSKIENNEYKNKFKQQVLSKSISIKNDIADLGRKKLIDSYKADYVYNKDLTVQSIISDVNPETKSYNTLLLNQRIQEMGENGIFSREDAAKEQVQVAKEIRVGEVKYDIAINPSEVVTQLGQGESGKYKHLTVDERAELENKAREQVKRNKQIDDDVKIDNRLDIFNKYVENPEQFNDITLLNKIRVQDPELGEALEKGSSGLYFVKTDDEAFATTVKAVFDADNKEDISKFLMNVLNANDNRTISGDKLAILVKAANDRAQELKTAKDAETKVLSPKQTDIDARVKSLIMMSNPFVKVSDMLVNFFQGMSSGKTPEQAHKEAVKSEFQRSGVMQNAPKEGKILQDKFGNKVRVMADGSVEEIK